MPAYTVADFLLDRLAELGVDRIFGVPGDFTLQFLDHIDAHPVISWTGAANELGAGYAADGYARVRGLGVVSTTFGVGELSAINAVAGAFAERVPLLSLVGSPTTAVQSAGRPTHHTLGDGDFGHTARMTAEVTVAHEVLTRENARAQIDRVLVAMLSTSLPGYISVPADIGELPCDPPADPLVIPVAESDPAALTAFGAAARSLLGAERPVVLADILVNRARAEDELHTLLSAARLRFSTLLWGRRVADESSPDYIGTYVGAASDPSVLNEIEQASRIITVGVIFTDLISGFFSQKLRDDERIDVLPHSAIVAGRVFEGVEMRDALRSLTDLLATGAPVARQRPLVPAAPRPAPASIELTQDVLWTAVASMLRSGDLVLADQGTSFYGIGAERLPHDVLFIGQPLWASIGYTLPALLGAALADRRRRPVLLIGDGAAQLTAADLSTIIRSRVPAVIVVVNNGGYTVERAIHGPDKPYNDIGAWRWTTLPDAFGAEPGTVQTFIAKTPADLLDALDAAETHPELCTFIEAVTAPLDVPPLLAALAEAVSATNAKK